MPAPEDEEGLVLRLVIWLEADAAARNMVAVISIAFVDTDIYRPSGGSRNIGTVLIDVMD